MKKLLILSTILAGAAAFANELVRPAFKARLLYVSPIGDDAADGDKEHPLRTPVGARDRIRAWRAAAGGTLPPGGVIVTFQDGEYRLSRPFALSAEDSGTPECAILYRAANKGKAVLCGYADLDWREEGGRLVADVPEEMEIPSLFAASEYLHSELLPLDGNPWTVTCDGERLGLAQWPRVGFARVSLDGIDGLTPYGRTMQTFGKSFGAIDEKGRRPSHVRLSEEPELWAQANWRLTYCDMTLRVVGQDVEKGLFTVERPDDRHKRLNHIIANEPVRLLNVHSELVPGTWAFDRAKRRVIAISRLAGAKPRIGAATELVVATNVTDVAFRGFAMEGARRAAVVLANCRDVALVGLTVRHVSGWGARVEGGRNCRVAGCDLYGLGRGGVYLEGGVQDTLTPSGHVVDNCHVHDYAQRVWNYNPGVMLIGVGNRAIHNLVHHSYHQAFSHYGSLNRFEANVVHDVCTMTDDAGAIYSYNNVNAWSHRGNAIVGNVLHAVGPTTPGYYQTDGIYIDCFTSGTIVEGNLVSAASFGIFSSGGQSNRIRRNLVMRTRKEGIRRWNLGLQHGYLKFHHVIDGHTNDCDRASYLMKPLIDRHDLYSMDFWRERFPNMLKPLALPDPVLAHDARFCEIVSNVLADAHDVWVVDEEQTREHTVVGGNVTIPGDPGFVDYLGLDWRLKADSPARAVLGGDSAFANAGLYDSDERASPAVKWGVGVRRPEPFPTIPYVADIRPFIDESQPLARMAFPKDVRAFGWRHRPGEDITNAMNVAWMYPRLRKIYVPAKAFSPEALKELRALLDEWTCGHAKIEVAGENE